MATSPFSPRACILLRQLQRQCVASQRLLVATRQSSSQTKPKPPPEDPGLTLGDLFEQSASQDKKKTKTPLEPYGKKDKTFVPQPLLRPLGIKRPPQPGENTGIDTRTYTQRTRDLGSVDKNLERRKTLLREGSRPAYLDWHNLTFSQGKLWVAPERLFKADTALYFPNMHGVTLETPHDGRDTTNQFADSISVVSVYSGQWASNQCDTFTKNNKELQDMLARGREGRTPLQKIDINIEERFLRSLMLRMFMRNLRRLTPQEDHERYFIVKKGFSQDVKDAIGFLNRTIGYTYLVDQECRIRWAASAEAEAGEVTNLTRLTAKLVHDYRRTLGEKHWLANGFDPNIATLVPSLPKATVQTTEAGSDVAATESTVQKSASK